MKLCWFCPKCKCKKCIFHSIDDNGEESCYWGYIEEVREWLKQPHTERVVNHDKGRNNQVIAGNNQRGGNNAKGRVYKKV